MKMFEVIEWRGHPAEPVKYAVVEIDRDGPILRGGPYDQDEAGREAERLNYEATLADWRPRHECH
jgi:hypothetical protein